MFPGGISLHLFCFQVCGKRLLCQFLSERFPERLDAFIDLNFKVSTRMERWVCVLLFDPYPLAHSENNQYTNCYRHFPQLPSQGWLRTCTTLLQYGGEITSADYCIVLQSYSCHAIHQVLAREQDGSLLHTETGVGLSSVLV